MFERFVAEPVARHDAGALVEQARDRGLIVRARGGEQLEAGIALLRLRHVAKAASSRAAVITRIDRSVVPFASLSLDIRVRTLTRPKRSEDRPAA